MTSTNPVFGIGWSHEDLGGVRIRPREESEDFQGRAKDESKDSMFGFFMFGSFIRGLFLFQSIGKRQKDLVDKKGAKHPFRRPESAHKASLSE